MHVETFSSVFPYLVGHPAPAAQVHTAKPRHNYRDVIAEIK
jgi:hypothetical protein